MGKMKQLPDEAGLATAAVNAKCGFVLAAAILMLMNAGCEYRQSEVTRAKSFAPYAGRPIGQVDAATFLQSRVAVLVSSEVDPAIKWRAGDWHMPVKGNLGCAAAVDSRGYYLTARHCLVHTFTYLVCYDYYSTNGWVGPARVVWRGDPKKGEPDLAILHVERKLDRTFELVDAVLQNEAALAVGLAWTNQPSRSLLGLELLAGKTVEDRKRSGPEADSDVATDVPVQPGDSGGPLLDAEGRLIGINIKGTPPAVHVLLPKRFFPMIATRPNRKWLQETIEADAASHPEETAAHMGDDFLKERAANSTR